MSWISLRALLVAPRGTFLLMASAPLKRVTCHSRLGVLACVVAMLLYSSHSALASPGDLLLTINNPTPETGDGFGSSVAITPNGDFLVGARNDNTGAVATGSAYLFDGATGNLLLTLNNPTPAHVDYFGWSVAATPSGDLLVGAYLDDTGAVDAGSAYLFDGITGSLLFTLNNPEPGVDDRFGVSVATTPVGDLLVGAYRDDTGAVDAGSAYLFDGATGDLLLTLNNPTPSANDDFGYGIASTPNGDLLIGARWDDSGAPNTGAAYLFDGTTGDLLLTINNPEPAGGEQFGWSVASTPSGDLLIGAYLDDVGAADAGSAYLFDGVTGGLLLTLDNPAPGEADQFGYSVASTPSGDLLASAHWDSSEAAYAGSAYLLDGATGSLLFTIGNPVPGLNDQFGKSLAVTAGGDFLVSAWFNDVGLVDGAGTIYLFEGTPSVPSATSRWSFDENTGCVASDSVGTNNGDLRPVCSANHPEWTPGKINWALNFDGSDDVVRVPADLSLQPEQITVAAWVKPDTLGNWDTVLMNASTSSWRDGYGLYYRSTTGVSFYINHYNIKVSAPISLGIWTHVAATYDMVEMKLYIDGMLADTLAYTQPVNYPSSTVPLLIGKGNGGNTAYGWDGLIDEVQLFGSALSGAEVQVLCEQVESATPGITVGAPNGGEELDVGSLEEITWASQNISGNVRIEYSKDNFVADVNEIDAFTPDDGSFDWLVPNDLSTTVRVRISDAVEPSIFDVSNGDFSIAVTTASVWQFDENTGCAALDSVGANHGTLGSSCPANAPTWVPGMIGSALSFDGADDVVLVAADSSLQPAEITVAAWLNPNILGQWDTVLMNAYATAWVDGYGLYFNVNTGINFYINRYNSSKVSASISPGVWTHVAATYDMVQIKLYVDGVLADTFPYTQPIDYPSAATPLLIGKGTGGASSYVWDGMMDDVRLYGRALSDAEVQAVYLGL